jgi:hypothetical protein
MNDNFVVEPYIFFCNMGMNSIKDIYKFDLIECITPYEAVVWTSKPLKNEFYLSYELKKYLHGVVQPNKIITEYIEINNYFENLGLFRSTFVLDDLKQYFDKSIYRYGTANVEMFIHVSQSNNMKGMNIFSYNLYL